MNDSTPPQPRQDAAPRCTVEEPASLASVPPLDRVSPQFTLRGVLTGMVLGGVLSICNIYVGLRLGIAFNMSIAAALLGYGFWSFLHHGSGRAVTQLGMLENNISQTAASAGAYVASAGLAASIPALALVTGRALPWPSLALWVFSVCLVGIVVAVGLRRQMLGVDQLPFAVGIASAETLRELHGRGRDALRRLTVLSCGALAAAICTVGRFFTEWPALKVPGRITGFSLGSLTFSVDPQPVLLGIGGLIGFRNCLSLLVGSVLAYGVLAPPLIQGGTLTVVLTSQGTAEPMFRDMLSWFVWPGAALMVVAALTSFAFSWRSAFAALGVFRRHGEADAAAGASDVSWRLGLVGLVAALVLSVTLQIALFDVPLWAAVLAVLMTFVLAIVAARVAGETGLNPVGQMSKVSQLLFGALLPTQPTANLTAANVTGGAASQCADLLSDLKCGHLLGASPRAQSLAQVCGAAAGAVVGAFVYVSLIHSPQEQLFTAEWPAPAVSLVKAVADLFQTGFGALPAGTVPAMLLAAAAGVLLPVVERLLPASRRGWVLSAASLGFGFVLPVSVTLMLFLGGLLALVLQSVLRGWSARFLVAACTGLILGDTLPSMVLDIARVMQLI